MNIIEAVRQAVETFPKIAEVCNEVHIDFTEPEPTGYGLTSIGDKLISEDILGNQERQHSFLLYSVFSGINDYERLANSSVLVELTYWLEQRTDIQIESQCGGSEAVGTITKITAENGMICSVSPENPGDGIQYQLQITAFYTVEKRGI